MTSTTNFTEDYHKLLTRLAELVKDTAEIDNEPQDEYTIVNDVFNDKQVTCDLILWMTQFFEYNSKSKSTTICNEWTSSAKVLYKKKKYEEAISCYNICLDYAPRDDLCFANGLNSRARVFCDCKKFQEAKNDIELLLSVGSYPIEKSYKIYSKLAKCHFMTRNISEGEAALKKALEHLLNTSGLSPKEMDVINLKMSSMAKKSTYISKKHEILPLLEKININLNGSSDALLLAYTKLKGRHIVSKVDLKNDELLFVEEPFAFVTLPSESTSAKVCSSCGILTEYIIVCDKCCDSHYCSEGCRIIGWDYFHQWECEGSKISFWSNIGIVHLAFRVVLEAFKNKYDLDAIDSKSLHNAKSLLSHLNSREHNSKYGKVFHLLTNQDKISRIDLRKYAIASIMVLLYLKRYTKFFESLKDKLHFEIPIEELELFIACLLYRHVLQMISNASAINSEKPLDGVVGVGIYPSSSMMNHSCVPNTKNTFYRNVFIVRAAKDIKAGSEIYNCYGPQVGQESAEERQDVLRKQYVFDCKCEACIDGI